MFAWATAAVACSKSSSGADPTQAQCAQAVDHWLLAESQQMADMVSDNALADDSEAVRATVRKSFDAYQAEMPQRRAAIIAKCVAAKWQPAVLQCMNAVKKEGTSFCEDLMGPIDDMPTASTPP
ncbi:MAG: hypothetical protein KBG15_04915 [Kofleriaceae bacterium]|nr:hypothetical protein [Kofleriaceae bacterium]